MTFIFLILNTIIFLCTSLGILMFANNLKRINRSVDIYLNPKAYKPKSDIRLIALLVDKYNQYGDNELVDLDVLIVNGFYNERIGKFKTSVIETLATRGIRLLWVSVIAMVIMESLTVGLGKSNINSVMIIISAGLSVVLALYELYSDLDNGKNQLFLKIKNYLNNEYPLLKTNQKEKEEVSLLLTKIEKLEEKISNYENVKQSQKQDKKKEEETLQEEDIIQILQSFNMFT